MARLADLLDELARLSKKILGGVGNCWINAATSETSSVVVKSRRTRTKSCYAFAKSNSLTTESTSIVTESIFIAPNWATMLVDHASMWPTPVKSATTRYNEFIGGVGSRRWKWMAICFFVAEVDRSISPSALHVHHYSHRSPTPLPSCFLLPWKEGSRGDEPSWSAWVSEYLTWRQQHKNTESLPVMGWNLLLLSLYLSVKRSHHVRREGLEIHTLIQKREEYTSEGLD
jgi:hypothetical protein